MGRSVRARQQRRTRAVPSARNTDCLTYTPEKGGTSTLTGQEKWQWLVRVTEIGEGDTTCPEHVQLQGPGHQPTRAGVPPLDASPDA